MPTDNPNTPRSSADIEAELSSLLPEPQTLDDTPGDSSPAAPSDDEIEASHKGWVAKDDYSGDPAKWVDAKTFNQRGKLFNANLQREVAALTRRVAEFEGTKAQFKKFHEETIAKKDAEFADAIKSLRVQRSQATRDGEDEEAIALEDQIDLLKTQRTALKDVPAEQSPPSTAPAPNPDDPVLLEWIEDGNKWFHEDAKLRDYAVSIGNDLVASGVTTRGRAFLNMISDKMAEEFPRRFKAPVTGGTRYNAVEGNGQPSSRASGGKTEADLPPDDFKLMKQFIKEGWVTKDSFLKSYFERNPSR